MSPRMHHTFLALEEALEEAESNAPQSAGVAYAASVALRMECNLQVENKALFNAMVYLIPHCPNSRSQLLQLLAQ